MSSSLGSTNLEGILKLVNALNTLFESQFDADVTMEFPEGFALISNSGYSLGEIVYDPNGEDGWIFIPLQEID